MNGQWYILRKSKWICTEPERCLPLKGIKNFDLYILSSVYSDSEVLGGDTHRLNTVESHGESDIEILSSCSLLHNDTKELGSFMSTETNPDSPTKWTRYPGAFVMLAYERLSKQG